MIGDRVKHARLYHGWTQQTLADLAGVSQSAIRQIELTGNVSEDTLARISDATDFARWWFDLGPLPDLPSGSLRFRKRASATKRDEERLRAYARQTIEAITRHLEASGAQLPPVRIRPMTEHLPLSREMIQAKAAEARESLGVGPNDPIRNLTNAAERSGIVVVGIAHELQKHDAVSFVTGYLSPRPYIFFTRGHSGDRQRFSLAHEIGHLVLHAYAQVDPETAEREADIFAAELLMPEESALEDIGAGEFVSLRSLAEVKARWGISVRALIRRALDVHLIDAQRRTSLEKQYSARGWHRGEPVLVKEERPALMRSLMDASVGNTSPTRLRASLGLPIMAARELVA